MNLVTELERLADTLAGETGDPAQISFVSVAERIARGLSVRTDEVAILGVSQRWRHLHFAPRLPALISPRKISEKSLRSAIRSGNSFNAPSPTKFLAKICDRPQNISSIACIGSLVPLQIVKRNLGNALTHQNLLVTFPQHKIFMSYPYGGTAHRHHGVRR